MNYLNRKINSFTLMEMVVVLLLTAIVVGLAFSVLNLVNKHLNIINANLEQQTSRQILEQSLWLDFNKYSKVKFDVNSNELRFYSEIDSIVYSFNNTNIAKSSDTFNINFKYKQFYFKGIEKETGYIDAIKLMTKGDVQSQSIFVYKLNDATSFIE